MRKASKTVYVAMSGGVDSSVAAALLKKRGFNVVGVFMKPWQPKGTVCLWEKDREDALRVAAILEIPFLTWDFSKEYKRSVADYMIREYKTGRTPNPDVMCNKEIKFGLFFKRAMKAGADLIATGHYIRLRNGKLCQGKDKNKDQSYFLWTLKKEILGKCIFPVGEYTKPEVRKLARKFNLPNAVKKDSQGVCFIGPLDMKSFLAARIKSKMGRIIHVDGRELGTHDGVFYYTIGQRHGLDIKDGQGPHFVVSKDFKKNILYVGHEKNLLSQKAKLRDINWINSRPNLLPAVIDVKVRYRTPSKKAIMNKDGTIEFIKPERAITSGQSAVLYRGSQLLGGGIIV